MLLRYLLQVVLVSNTAASSSLHPRWTPTEPCAIISSSSSAFRLTSKATPTVDAQLAYDCLNSAKLHQEEATDLVEAILPFIEFQSTIEYMKNPPAGFLEPAVDIRAGFADILSKISSSTYKSEYEFQAELFALFNSVHDAHFRFNPDLLVKALRFRRPLPLVSMSIDGRSEPKIYAYGDILISQNSNFVPSALTKINGKDAYEYMEELSQLGRLQDPDALYNTMFVSPALVASNVGWEGYFAGTGLYGYIYPGANTSASFENGTTITVKNFANVVGSFANVIDGESLYNEFCSVLNSASTTTPSADTGRVSGETPPGATLTEVTALSSMTARPTSSSSKPAVPPPGVQPTGYPRPVIVTSDRHAGGYYIPNSDVAVLSLLSFSPAVPIEWQVLVEKFLAKARADGKTELIVDLSGNGGGLILQGYDVFRQLFPQIVQDGFTRFRAHPAFVEEATVISNSIPVDFDPATSADTTLIYAYETITNYRYSLNVNNETFPNLAAMLGPSHYYDDNFTDIIRWNFSDPLTTVNDTLGLGEWVTGYGPRTNFTQPFAAEDIVMLYDGYCSSTCTIFSEFMRIQGGVKSIALGGRSSSEGVKTPIIQAVGGVKGSNNYGYVYLNYLARMAMFFGSKSGTIEKLTNTLPNLRSTDNSINVRDNILRGNLADGTPAHFIYEPADCRLFFTPAMANNVTAIWEAAAKSAWGGGNCNAGGFSKGYGGTRKRSVGGLASVTEVIIMDGIRTDERSEEWMAVHYMDAPK